MTHPKILLFASIAASTGCIYGNLIKQEALGGQDINDEVKSAPTLSICSELAEKQNTLSVVVSFVRGMATGAVRNTASHIDVAKVALSELYYMDDIRTDALTTFCNTAVTTIREWQNAKAEFVQIWDLIKDGLVEQSGDAYMIKDADSSILCIAYSSLHGEHYHGGLRLPEHDGIIDIYNNCFKSILQQTCRFMFVFGKDDEASLRKGIEEAFSQEKAWLENMKRQYQILSSVALPSSRSSLTDEDVKILIQEFLMLEDSAQKL